MKISYAFAAAALATGSVVTLTHESPAGAQLVTEGLRSPAMAPAGAPVSFVELTQKLQPAVVNISTKLRVKVGTALDWRTGERREITDEGSADGSGFLISEDGLIVTNNHVVTGPDRQPAEAIYVTLTNGKEYTAELIGRDATSDLAVLRIKGGPFPYVQLGDSNDTQVGEWVLAIGNPLGIGSSVTAGIVSAVERSAGRGAYDRLIQTDTAINPGNSGGPLFDLAGHVIGINNRQLSLTRGNIGINFAIPASEAKPVIEALIAGEAPQRGYLGVSTTPLDPDTAGALGLEEDHGELVREVVEGEAAEKAGLTTGDIITEVNGNTVTDKNSLAYLISRTKPGSSTKLKILREGKPQTLTVTIGTRPTEAQIAASRFQRDEENSEAEVETPDANTVDRYFYDNFGMKVEALTASIARQLGFPRDQKGVVVTGTTQYGTARRTGLNRGDVIVSANYKDIASPDDLAAIARQAKKENRPALCIGVRSPGQPIQYGTIRFAEK